MDEPVFFSPRVTLLACEMNCDIFLHVSMYAFIKYQYNVDLKKHHPRRGMPRCMITPQMSIEWFKMCLAQPGLIQNHSHNHPAFMSSNFAYGYFNSENVRVFHRMAIQCLQRLETKKLIISLDRLQLAL